MIDKWLSKTKLNTVVEKIVRKLFLNKISANQLTFAALIFGLSSAVIIFLSGILTWKIESIIIATILIISYS